MSKETSKTTTEEKFWYGYVADDHNGHKGSGYSPEVANEALQEAQRHDLEYAEHKSITGIITHGPKNK